MIYLVALVLSSADLPALRIRLPLPRFPVAELPRLPDPIEAGFQLEREEEE